MVVIHIDGRNFCGQYSLNRRANPCVLSRCALGQRRTLLQSTLAFWDGSATYCPLASGHLAWWTRNDLEEDRGLLPIIPEAHASSSCSGPLESCVAELCLDSCFRSLTSLLRVELVEYISPIRVDTFACESPTWHQVEGKKRWEKWDALLLQVLDCHNWYHPAQSIR